MPDYCDFKVAGCYLYFTSKCVVEAMHVHADPKRARKTAGKFWVYEDGHVEVMTPGTLKPHQVSEIIRCIERNYQSFCEVWADFCGTPSVSEIQFKRK